MEKVLIEVCCGGIEDVLAAQHCGADRIEFCSALPLGGLTPSLGTFLYARERVTLPIMVMIRPRESGFCYSDQEFEAMLKDVQLFVEHGAEGVVFGCLTPCGDVDIPRCKLLLEAAGSVQTVFHRAFDVVANWEESLEDIIDLGFTRILTSGRCPSITEGMPTVAKIIEKAKGRIEIIGGSGVRPDNAVQILKETGLRQIHLSATGSFQDTSTDANQRIHFGAGVGYDNTYRATDAKKLTQTIHRIQGEFHV